MNVLSCSFVGQKPDLDHWAKIKELAGPKVFLEPLGDIPFPYLSLLPEGTHITLSSKLAMEDAVLNTLYLSDPSLILASLPDYSQERLSAFTDSCH